MELSPDKRRKVGRDELLKRAIEVIQKKGYRDASLQDIADEFSVTKAALYYYVRSKETLLYEIYKETIIQLISELESLINQEGLEVTEKLSQVVHSFVSLCINHPEMEIFFEEKRNLSEEHFEDISKCERSVISMITALFDEGIKQGAVRSVNSKALTFGLLGMSSWVYRWFSKDGELTEDEVAELYHSVLLSGYVAPAPA